MNILLSHNKSVEQYGYYNIKENEKLDTKTFGDVLAVTLIVAYTLLALLVSSWSAFLFFTGRLSGGPIEFIFKKIVSIGIG